MMIMMIRSIITNRKIAIHSNQQHIFAKKMAKSQTER